MPTQKPFLVIALFSILLLACIEALAYDVPSAYEMLEKFDFPMGILPEGVQSYVLNPDDSFEVLLPRDCEFMVEGGYLLKYKRKITGRVEVGSLKELRGVSVKVVLMWFNIDKVLKAKDCAQIDFYVGPLSASFPAYNFEQCPKCGCGFRCATALL